MAVDPAATTTTPPAKAPAAPPKAPAPSAPSPISRGHESNNVNKLNDATKPTPDKIADNIIQNILKQHKDLGDRMIAFGKAYNAASNEVKRSLWYGFGLGNIVEDEVRYCFGGLGQSINDKDYPDFVKTLVADVAKRNLPREIKLAFLHRAHFWAHNGGGRSKADIERLKSEIDKLISAVEKEGPDPSWLSSEDKGGGYPPVWLKSYRQFETWD